MLKEVNTRLITDFGEGNQLTSSFEPNGPSFENDHTLVPAIAQDLASGEVLMLAYMNRAAWELTLSSGEAVYYSRSRDRLWKKGEESGNVQKVREIYIDCDADTVLLKVEQIGGAACHQGYVSCFFRQRVGHELKVIAERVFDPQQVYDKN